MRVAVYLRETAGGIAVPEQYRELEGVAQEKGLGLHLCIYDPGNEKAGEFRKNESFWFLMYYIYVEREIDGVLFWNAGHLAGGLVRFLSLIKDFSDEGIYWYMHHPALENSQGDGERFSQLSGQLLELHNAISDETLANRSARMKAAMRRPGRKKISEFKEYQIRTMRGQKIGMNEIAKTIRVGNSTVTRVLKESSR